MKRIEFYLLLIAIITIQGMQKEPLPHIILAKSVWKSPKQFLNYSEQHYKDCIAQALLKGLSEKNQLKGQGVLLSQKQVNVIVKLLDGAELRTVTLPLPYTMDLLECSYYYIYHGTENIIYNCVGSLYIDAIQESTNRYDVCKLKGDLVVATSLLPNLDQYDTMIIRQKTKHETVMSD